jgi:hypothetical protein
MTAVSEKRWFMPELQLRPVANQRGHVRNALNGAALELSSGAARSRGC